MQSSIASRHILFLRFRHSFYILLSDILNLYSSLSVRDQFKHPHKTAVKIMALYLKIWAVKRRRENKSDLKLNSRKRSLTLLISSCTQFWFVTVVLKYFSLVTFTNNLITISKLRLFSVLFVMKYNRILFISVLSSSLLLSNRASAFHFKVFMSSSNTLISPA